MWLWSVPISMGRGVSWWDIGDRLAETEKEREREREGEGERGRKREGK